jgi:tRNA pseudouridine55 synthase
MADPARTSAPLPVQHLLVGHPPVTLDAENAGRFLSGVRRHGNWADSERIAVFGPQSQGEQPCEALVLLGSAHAQAGELIPGRLLSPIEIQQILETAS